MIEWTRATNATEALMAEFEAEAELYANLLRLFDREIAREPSSAAADARRDGPVVVDGVRRFEQRLAETEQVDDRRTAAQRGERQRLQAVARRLWGVRCPVSDDQRVTGSEQLRPNP